MGNGGSILLIGIVGFVLLAAGGYLNFIGVGSTISPPGMTAPDYISCNSESVVITISYSDQLSDIDSRSFDHNSAKLRESSCFPLWETLRYGNAEERIKVFSWGSYNLEQYGAIDTGKSWTNVFWSGIITNDRGIEEYLSNMGELDSSSNEKTVIMAMEFNPIPAELPPSDDDDTTPPTDDDPVDDDTTPPDGDVTPPPSSDEVPLSGTEVASIVMFLVIIVVVVMLILMKK